MYARPPQPLDPEALARLGMRPEDFAVEEKPTLVWPDNVQALAVFIQLATQWRVGFGGCTGLDYGVIPTTLELMGLPRSDWPALFDDLRVMELAALKEIRKP